MSNTTGYGILADDPQRFTSSVDDAYSSEFSQASMLISSEHRDYGTLASSVSPTDSYNRWYVEGYDTGISGSIQYNHHQSLDDTDDRRQSYPYDTENEFGTAYSCEGSCCSDPEGAVIVTTDHVHHQLHGYPSPGETSGGEQTYYSPFYERKSAGIASTALVGWNIINLLLSTSLLAFPFAVAKGGLIVLPFIVVICAMTIYTSRILINMMYEKSTVFHGRKIRVRVDYADLGQDVFNSYKGAWFIQTIQVFEMLSICVLNICVLGNLCHEILPKLNIQLCTVIVALLALPTFFVRRLAVIGWMQTIGVLSLAIGLILVQGYCVANVSKWNYSYIKNQNDLYKLPIAIGIIIYAFGIQGVMPGLEEQMRKPKRFGIVVNFSFIIAAIVQIIFSVTNALLYGKTTNQVILIDLEAHLPLGIATACFIGVSILSHFSLPTFVVLEKLDNAIHNMFPCCPSHGENRFHTLLSIGLRVFVMAISSVIAVFIPYFAYLMAFVGSVITVLTSLIVPCWFHLKLRHRYMSWFNIAIDVVIILFGVTCFGVGSYYSFCAIYNDYNVSE